jgi:ABC-type Fe3+/spermidine/putrescine transport system ATPase subunit
MELRDLIDAQRKSTLGLTHEQQKALAVREFQYFINKAHIRDVAELKALFKQMRAVAAELGFSEYEIATIYRADVMLILRRLALRRLALQ